MTKTATRIVFFYFLFAGLSTVINICSQMLSMSVYREIYAVEISILIGTLAGLPLRYILEKRYIFSYQTKNIKHDGKLFLLYSLMGIFTTIIFWVVEYAFHFIFKTDLMRYIGGIVGLAFGYYFKYQLDKNYVFINNAGKVIEI